MAAPAAVLSILVKANTGQATTGLLRINQTLGGVEKRSQGAAKAVSGLVKTLTLVGGAGAAAGLGFAVKKAADFEEQLSSLGAVAEANGRQMDRFRKQALKAGADTKFSALEAAKAQTELAKGGLSVRQIMRGGLRSALALAAAGEMELADAAEATVNAMKLFGLRGKESMKVADAFATAANKTTADVSDFAMALKQGGSAAKASGLSFIEATAILEALAEAGIKGSDAGTSMKAALTQLAAPTAKQKDLAKKLNLEFFDQHGNMKSVTDISRMLGDRLDGLTKKQQLQAVKTLAGTDGMRALLAVYDAGPEKLAKFQRELGKEGTAADVAKRKQDNLKGSLEQLGGSVETLAIQVGTVFIPWIRRGADELRQFADKVGQIFARDDLTLGEKLQKAFDLAKIEAKPWVDKFVAAVERANLPEKIAGLISGATPLIAGAAARAAPIVVGAFIKGWLAADVWGRLAVGAWLLARMGGPPAFMRAGAVAGGAVGAGMATGVAASGLRGKLGGLFKAWGPTLGIGLALAIGPSLIRKLQDLGIAGELTRGRPETPQGAAGRAQEIADRAAGQGRQQLVKAREELAKFEADFRRIANAPGRPKAWQDYYSQIADAIAKVGAPIRDKLADFQAVDARVRQMGDNVARHLRGMEKGGSKNFKDLSHSVGVATRNMLKVGGKNSEETRKQIHRQFAIAANRVQQAMDDKVISVKTGTERLRELARKELKLYGISSGRVDVVLAKGPGSQGPRPHQRGGHINEGRSSGDSVPAMLERGEYVLNRNAVRKVGKGALDRLNYAAAPRFQQGGIVELLHPFNDPKGHGDHLHVAMSTVQGIVALGKRLQKLGWLVGEHPAFGGVGGGHAAQGYHYTGQAIDVNWPDPGMEAAKIRALLPMLGAADMLRVFEGLRRPQIRGPLSVALDAGQGALDRVHAAANAAVERAVGAMEGAEPGRAGGTYGKAALRALWTGQGGPAGRSNLAAAIALAESSGNPNASNTNTDGSIDRGLWQINSIHGALSTFDPAGNARAAVSISSGGSNWAPWTVYNTGAYRQFLQKGGLVGKIGKTLTKVHKGKTPKVRKPAVDKLIQRIKGVSLPAATEKKLKSLGTDAAVYGEYADRAAALTVTDASGVEIPGVVNGGTQMEWVQQQLEALFKWRNQIILAEEVVREKREQVAKAIEVARKRLENLQEQIRSTTKHRARLQKQLERAQKHPRRNKGQIKLLKARIDGADAHLKIRGRMRDALKDRILPALTGKRAALSTARGDLLSTLETVQGTGSPMTVLSALPGIGVLGGQIFDAQRTLQDLNAPKAQVTDTDTDTERTGLLEGLLREANLRTAVSEAQFKVLRDMPSFGGGGIVPGPAGSPRVIEAHGGEGVFTADQMAAIGAGSVAINIAPGMEWLRQFITVVAEDSTRKQARNAGRGLPGRGGGLTRG